MILRLPSIRAAISPSSHSSAELCIFPCETQNFASLLLPTTSLSLLSLFILPIAPASRDARFCVSRPAVSLSFLHLIALPDCSHSLVRRKILRLYFCQPHHYRCFPYSFSQSRQPVETQNLASPVHPYRCQSLVSLHCRIAHIPL